MSLLWESVKPSVIKTSIFNFTDAYKLGRFKEYPKGTTIVNEVLVAKDVSHFDKMPEVGELIRKHGYIVLGLQMAIEKTINTFKSCMFHINDSNEDFYSVLGMELDSEFRGSIKYLHEYILEHDTLPLKFEFLAEGTLVKIGTPILTIENTDPNFFWLPNFIETLLLSEVWLPIVAGTKNFYLRYMLEDFAKRTVGDTSYVQFQAHDFSMRGNQGLGGSEQVALAHLANFSGSDNLIGLKVARDYYFTKTPETFVLGSVPAFEHSSVTTNIQTFISQENISLREAEKKSLERFLTEVYPTGFVSYVADSYDFWECISILEDLKETILNRDGKVIVRPDSDDPYLCLTGREESDDEFQRLGLIRSLDKIFGSTVNEKGFKELNSKIGAIYGDSINYVVAKKILTKLEELGYASNVVVFGMGVNWQSHSTRDNLGIALKTTKAIVNGKTINVVKDPKTSSKHVKKSPKGDVFVAEIDNEIVWFDSANKPEDIDHYHNLLRINNTRTLEEIRSNITSNLEKISK